MLDTHLLERRINYRKFKLDEYPDKDKICQVVQEAINVAPVKSEVFNFKLDIWGPEHAQIKEDLMWSTVTKNPYKRGQWDRSIYSTKERWLRETKEYYKDNPENFNTQVQAPYLFALVEDNDSIWNPRNNKRIREWRTHINAGIWLYALALAANRHEIDTAYCICYGDHEESPILKGYRGNNYPRVLALMGAGYFDFNKDSLFSNEDGDDWIEHKDGGLYNTVTRKRNGYKIRKPNHDDLTLWR